MKESKKLSTGVLAAHGVHYFNDPCFLEDNKEKREREPVKSEKSAAGKKEALRKNTMRVKKLQDKHRHEITQMFSARTQAKCAFYLQYKRQSSKEPEMPKDLAQRRVHCVEWTVHPSPVATPQASDNKSKDGEDKEVDMDGVVAGLLGLASNANPKVGFDDVEVGGADGEFC